MMRFISILTISAIKVNTGNRDELAVVGEYANNQLSLLPRCLPLVFLYLLILGATRCLGTVCVFADFGTREMAPNGIVDSGTNIAIVECRTVATWICSL